MQPWGGCTSRSFFVIHVWQPEIPHVTTHVLCRFNCPLHETAVVMSPFLVGMMLPLKWCCEIPGAVVPLGLLWDGEGNPTWPWTQFYPQPFRLVFLRKKAFTSWLTPKMFLRNSFKLPSCPVSLANVGVERGLFPNFQM